MCEYDSVCDNKENQMERVFSAPHLVCVQYVNIYKPTLRWMTIIVVYVPMYIRIHVAHTSYISHDSTSLSLIISFLSVCVCAYSFLLAFSSSADLAWLCLRDSVVFSSSLASFSNLNTFAFEALGRGGGVGVCVCVRERDNCERAS